ncbi:MAG: hypothetical protein CMJ83_03385 [Planctomycetes bacterium]|nr:hypothetical protein [Planctomycetota bacterium]
MPEWFYPLMLLVFLAGQVFLFLQGRAAGRAIERLHGRLYQLEMLVKDEARAAAPTVAAEAPLPASEILDRLDALKCGLDDHAGGIDVIADRIAELERRVASRPSAQPGTEPSEDSASSAPDEIARKFLIGEGFSRIQVHGSDTTDDVVRLRVKAIRGDEVRQGHVSIQDGRVVDASMEVPTALFP